MTVGSCLRDTGVCCTYLLRSLPIAHRFSGGALSCRCQVPQGRHNRGRRYGSAVPEGLVEEDRKPTAKAVGCWRSRKASQVSPTGSIDRRYSGDCLRYAAVTNAIAVGALSCRCQVPRGRHNRGRRYGSAVPEGLVEEDRKPTAKAVGCWRSRKASQVSPTGSIDRRYSVDCLRYAAVTNAIAVGALSCRWQVPLGRHNRGRRYGSAVPEGLVEEDCTHR
jgi:hypothetical protein